MSLGRDEMAGDAASRFSVGENPPKKETARVRPESDINVSRISRLAEATSAFEIRHQRRFA
jgi:hypothetical protein